MAPKGVSQEFDLGLQVPADFDLQSLFPKDRLFLKQTPVTLFFRVLMNRMVLKIDPSQRKISMMITKITAIEVLVIILIVVGYVFFVK